MPHTTKMEEGFEPRVQSMLADPDILKLIERDGNSVDGINTMLHRVKQERATKGWTR